jgi:hypothetical protein
MPIKLKIDMPVCLSKFISELLLKRVSFADGSYVEWVHAEAIKYAEPSGRSMDIHWTFTNTFKKGRSLRLESLDQWEPPNENEPVSLEKRAEVVLKIKEYCRRRNTPLQII